MLNSNCGANLMVVYATHKERCEITQLLSAIPARPCLNAFWLPGGPDLPRNPAIIAVSQERYGGRCASGVAIEKDEVIIGHRHAEDGLQDDEPCRSGLEAFMNSASSDQQSHGSLIRCT